METSPLEASAAFRRDLGWEILADFADLLRLPNVTGGVEELRVNADELVRRFRQRGATVDVVEIDGASPVVVGELRTANPTAVVGVYVHYDGQPVDPADWSVPPFSATLMAGDISDEPREVGYPGPGDAIDPEWRIYARGASDDKTPLSAVWRLWMRSPRPGSNGLSI
jgi:acetylornithine deacetylase/succinyl-diaminopimelate desuccinylase-like protein